MVNGIMICNFSCGCHAVDASGIILYQLDLVAASLCIVQYELSAAQQLARSAAVLDQVELVQISIGLVVCSLLTIAKGQICFVLVRTRINLGFSFTTAL